MNDHGSCELSNLNPNSIFSFLFQAKCNKSHSFRNMETIVKDVAVLQTKLQNNDATKDLMKEMAALQAKVQTIEATNDLIKEIASLQAKVQAKEAIDDFRALQAEMKTMKETYEKSDQKLRTEMEDLKKKLEANDRLKTTQIQALQTKVKSELF